MAGRRPRADRRSSTTAALPGSIADATIALRRRRSRRRRTVALRLAMAGLALVVALALAWLVFLSPVLAARQVQVEGTSLLTPARVQAAAAVPLGRPMVRVDTDAVAERVRALAPVKDVRVTRHWPGTIRVRVSERVPVIQRRTGGGYAWSDSEGVVFHEQRDRAPDLAVVQAPDDERLRRDLATVASSLTPQLRKALLEIKAKSPDTITLTLSGGRTVVWGDAGQSATKAEVATALLAVKATVYDVSSPANPTSR